MPMPKYDRSYSSLLFCSLFDHAPFWSFWPNSGVFDSGWETLWHGCAARTCNCKCRGTRRTLWTSMCKFCGSRSTLWTFRSRICGKRGTLWTSQLWCPSRRSALRNSKCKFFGSRRILVYVCSHMCAPQGSKLEGHWGAFDGPSASRLLFTGTRHEN